MISLPPYVLERRPLLLLFADRHLIPELRSLLHELFTGTGFCQDCANPMPAIGESLVVMSRWSHIGGNPDGVFAGAYRQSAEGQRRAIGDGPCSGRETKMTKY